MEANEPANNRVARVRLDYLDSLRGLAAIEVLLHHAFGFAIGDKVYLYPRIMQIIYPYLIYGHYAVDAFIVISGYCLMLPVVKNPSRQLPNGVVNFVVRRARRIVPPYYAAILVSLIANQVLQHVYHFNTFNERITTAGLISHILIVQDFNLHWLGTINVVMWSIAVEWHIYFIFALLLIPAWRRFGALPIILIVAIVTLPIGMHFNRTLGDIGSVYPWYVALFAMGMAAAECNFSAPCERLRLNIPWRFAPVALLIATGGLILLLRGGKNHWMDDLCFGTLVSCFLAYVTQSILSGKSRTPLVKLLESRPLVFIGTFSYSIYLFHLPLIDIMRASFPPTHFSHAIECAIILPLQVLIAVLVSYGFYMLVERHFQNMPKKHMR